jgi:hypothetical protein
MRHYIYLIFLGILFSLNSCRKDFDTVASSGNLEFSKTEVYLDTVFSTISSSTYSLKVYNRSNDDIKIPTIQLGKGLNSKYRILVDGIAGNNKIFNNVELLAKDSMYIFIETTANISETEADFTYNDEILFDIGANQQKVKLITLIDDACFIFPNRSLDKKIYEKINVEGFVDENKQKLNGHTLTDAELNWTNAKPYVIYGNCVVPSGKTLNIAKGTRVHFHSGATLIVDNGATLNIQGELNLFDGDGKILTKNEVTFDGDRLEPEYEYASGQWGAVIILSGTNNQIKHLTLKNAVVGILTLRNNSATTPKLTIENSQIYDCASYGILARASVISGKNVVINFAGQTCLGLSQGGLYDFTHCTFNNNAQSTKQTAIFLNNYIDDDEDLPIPFYAKFDSSIIYGSNSSEIFIDVVGNQFILDFKYCLFKFNSTSPVFAGNVYNFINGNTNLFFNKKNIDPKFKNINLNQLNILGTMSGAYNGGNPINNFADIISDSSKRNFDIGSYSHLP